MNWDYIAGFFDGEGCVHEQRKVCQYTLTFSQCESQKKVLTVISKFLKANDVKHGLDRRRRTNPRHQMSWAVTIQGASNVLRFLRPIIENLIVKRAKAEQAIQFCEDVLQRKADRMSNIEKAVQAYVSGECPSINQARHKFGVADKTLRKYLFQLGHRPLRGRSETQSMIMKTYLKRHPKALEQLRQNGRKGAEIRWHGH